MVITDERDIDNIVFEPPELGCVLSLTGLPGGSGTIYDRSPYGNNGTIIGATWKRLPSGLWYLDFDGEDDYIAIPHATSINLSSTITLEVWVYLNNLDDWHTVASKMDDIDTGWQLVYAPAQDYFYFYTQSAVAIKSNTSRVSVATWTHLVMDYEGGTSNGHIYINGVDETDTVVAKLLETASSDLTIGVRSYDNTNDLSGSIALCRIYNRILTALEIQNHFNRERHLFGV